jgi:hypothetical protein
LSCHLFNEAWDRFAVRNPRRIGANALVHVRNPERLATGPAAIRIVTAIDAQRGLYGLLVAARSAKYENEVLHRGRRENPDGRPLRACDEKGRKNQDRKRREVW